MKKVISGSGKFEFKVNGGESLGLYLIQSESCESDVKIVLGKDSRADVFTLSTGGGIINKLEVELSGKGAAASLSGLMISGGNEKIENYTFVRHKVGHTSSNQTYKGILGGHSMGVFDGKIRVEKGADKSRAHQLNKNILLSDDATMQSKPQLEIFADDVKCTHGATTGRIDSEALFYLKARGVGEDEARKILIEAFVEDLISGIKDEAIQNSLREIIGKKLKI